MKLLIAAFGAVLLFCLPGLTQERREEKSHDVGHGYVPPRGPAPSRAKAPERNMPENRGGQENRMPENRSA
jgi:hypothetical protein